MSYKTKSNTSKSRNKRNRTKRARRIDDDLSPTNRGSASLRLSPSRAPSKTVKAIIFEANGRVNKGIKAECVAGVNSSQEVLTAKMDAIKVRNIYRRMYDQEAIDNERAAKVLAQYSERYLR